MGNKYTGTTNKFTGSTVIVRDGEFSRALRMFSKNVQESGTLETVKEKMSYEKPAVLKQRMKQQARKRWERKVEELITQGRWFKDKKY